MSDTHPTIKGIEKRGKKTLPEFRVGDTVKVFVKIREGEKERTQAFEGVVIKRQRGAARASFTVRKISYGVGVERIFPENSPNVERIEVSARGQVRRAKLYYLRELQGKAARIKEKSADSTAGAVAPAAPSESAKA